MSDQHASSREPDETPWPFAQLTQDEPATASSFSVAFRGYDKAEVDVAVAELSAQLRTKTDELAQLDERRRREDDALRERAETAEAESREAVERLEAELQAANAKLSKTEQQVQTLTEELVGATGESANRHQFEEILRVAEDQASLIIKNATVQADRLLETAREEVHDRRIQAQAEVDAILARAQHDAQQARLRIETEVTAHEAQIEREAAHAAEKVVQAEQEAAAIRSEAEKGAAALRSMVARETADARAEAEQTVRELRIRALDFEESLTRRQDDAQQEFLMLHNQAVAHAERITQDANDQVTASLDHAQRVSAKADDFDRLMRARALQVEADADVRAREILDRAREKAEKIINTVTGHSQAVLRDAEDRTRQLRWQQHQLTSFMAEVKELMRPEAPVDFAGADAGALEPEAEEEAEVELEPEVIAEGEREPEPRS